MLMSRRTTNTWDILELIIDDALDEFYDYVDASDELSPFMDGHDHNRLKKVQRDHWHATVRDRFNDVYYDRLNYWTRACPHWIAATLFHSRLPCAFE